MGDNIREWRERRKLSQAALARASGVPQSLISMLEAGERQNPSMETLRKLATALDCRVDDLIPSEDDKA